MVTRFTCRVSQKKNPIFHNPRISKANNNVRFTTLFLGPKINISITITRHILKVWPNYSSGTQWLRCIELHKELFWCLNDMVFQRYASSFKLKVVSFKRSEGDLHAYFEYAA